MKNQVKIMAWIVLLCASQNMTAQLQENAPKNDIVKRTILSEKSPLHYPPLREADILWEKNVWRVIDVREKINFSFVYPEAPLFEIFSKAAQEGKLSVYSPLDDNFSIPLTAADVESTLFRTDTTLHVDVEDFTEKLLVVKSQMNWEDVKRYRVKEKWFFDKNTSTMKVRILGIAPLKEVYNEIGDFLYETPLFWIAYQEARGLLASHRAFTAGGNQATKITLEDLFEMRYFSSYVYKEDNVHNRRIQDYMSGVDGLGEGQSVDASIRNLELDLWSW